MVLHCQVARYRKLAVSVPTAAAMGLPSAPLVLVHVHVVPLAKNLMIWRSHKVGYGKAAKRHCCYLLEFLFACCCNLVEGWHDLYGHNDHGVHGTAQLGAKAALEASESQLQLPWP